MNSVLRLGILYFAAVFAAGFALGVVRVLAVEPQLGAPAAELVEMPVMLLWCWLVARWAVRRLASGLGQPALLAAGGFALALLLAVEVTVVLGLRGLTFDSYLAQRDGVALGAYLLALLVFAILPWLAGRHRCPDATK